MTTHRIVAQLIAHHSVQAFESFAHIDRFHREINLGRQSQAEHALTRHADQLL